jgi:hypothetical protein
MGIHLVTLMGAEPYADGRFCQTKYYLPGCSEGLLPGIGKPTTRDWNNEIID